jgi:YD repeat-containing protein
MTKHQFIGTYVGKSALRLAWLRRNDRVKWFEESPTGVDQTAKTFNIKRAWFSFLMPVFVIGLGHPYTAKAETWPYWRVLQGNGVEWHIYWDEWPATDTTNHNNAWTESCLIHGGTVKTKAPGTYGYAHWCDNLPRSSYSLAGYASIPIWFTWGAPPDQFKYSAWPYGTPYFCSSGTGACAVPPKNNGPSSSCKDGQIDFGNPVNSSTGNKWQYEVDLTQSFAGLEFSRYYNGGTPDNKSHLGIGWTHPYARSITALSSGAFVEILRPDGKKYIFRKTASSYTSDADITETLIEIKDSADVPAGWQYTTDSNEIELYDVNGKLLSLTDRVGRTQILTYSCTTISATCPIATPASVAPYAGLLIKVTDSLNHSLNFTYNSAGQIASLTDPGGNITRYGYDTNGNLRTVTYPDDTPANLTNNPKKTYVYGELVNTANVSQPNALTGIIDENGGRYATYRYNAQGRTISTEHAGSVEKYSFAYAPDGSSTAITDPLGTVRTAYFTSVLGVVKSKGQSQPGGSGCGASASALNYDANGNVTSRTDFNGHRTDYAYDLNRNLETRRTEGLTASGAATPATRTITTLWHPTLRLPVQVTNGNQQTTYSYNSQGEVTEKTITDTATHTARTWATTYAYGAVPGVLVQKVEDGPRTDVADLTTYDYYPADASCAGGHFGCRGQLQQVTDALGHITRLTRYNAHGKLEEFTDPNGLVTTLTYDARQRLLSLDRGGETTTYTYDPVGQLTRVTRPDGSYLAYSYDAAHRLIQTQDNLGNALTYTLDALGNRVQEEAHDPSGQLARSQSRVYDALSRLQNLIQPQ